MGTCAGESQECTRRSVTSGPICQFVVSNPIGQMVVHVEVFVIFHIRLSHVEVEDCSVMYIEHIAVSLKFHQGHFVDRWNF